MEASLLPIVLSKVALLQEENQRLRAENEQLQESLQGLKELDDAELDRCVQSKHAAYKQRPGGGSTQGSLQAEQGCLPAWARC